MEAGYFTDRWLCEGCRRFARPTVDAETAQRSDADVWAYAIRCAIREYITARMQHINFEGILQQEIQAFLKKNV